MSRSIAGRWRRAQGYLSRMEPAPARAQLEAMRAQDGADVRTRLLESRIAWRDDAVRAATRAALEAFAVVPDDAALLCDTIESLLQVGEVVAARDCLARPALAGAATPAVLMRLADFTQRLNQHDESLAWIERAVAAGADDPDTRFHHGSQLYFHGRMAEAEAVLDACLAAAPDHGRAAYTRAYLDAPASGPDHFAQLDAGLARVARGSPDHAALEFTRYKAFENLGRFAEAWDALAAGNAVMRARLRFDATARIRFLDRLVGTCTAERLRVPATMPTEPGPQPIFIVGMPRSGSTLLDRMIANHSAVRSAGELVDFGTQLQWCVDTRNDLRDDYPGRLAMLDFRELGRRYLAQTRWRAGGGRFFIDKQPPNWMVAGLIHAALPAARIIHLVREPMDLCFSNWRAYFGDAYGYSYDLATLAAWHRAHMRVMAHWDRAMPGAILHVAYTDLVRDTEAILRTVFDYCGLPWEPGCADPQRNTTPVVTPGVAQLRGPVHARAAGAWRGYAAQLGTLQTALSDHENPFRN